jgi:trimeric autotransporter adhesin
VAQLWSAKAQSPRPIRALRLAPGGNLAVGAYGPQDIASMQSSIGSLQNSIVSLRGQVNRAHEGTAMAMGGGVLPDNKKFALSMYVGTFSGQSGGAVSALCRLTNNVAFDAGVGAGFAQGGIGARGGYDIHVVKIKERSR